VIMSTTIGNGKSQFRTIKNARFCAVTKEQEAV